MNKTDEKIISSALRSHLSGLHLSAQAHAALHHRIQGGEQVKKRMPLALALAMALIVITLTALAVTSMIEQHTREVLELGGVPLARWQLADKMAFIDTMERAELPMNQEELAALRKPETTDEEKERLADSLIDARYGQLLADYRKELDVEEYDLPKAPSAVVVFREGYLREHPEASKEELEAAFNAFMMDYHKDTMLTAEEQKQLDEQRAGERATEADILAKMSGELTETSLGLDAWELTKATITATFDEAHRLWLGQASIHEKDIAEGKREWLMGLKQHEQNTFFEYQDGIFTVSQVYEENGERVTDAHTIEDYEYLKLIPLSAWGEYRSQGLAWKAEFTKAYRDNSRAWLAAHPDYVSKTNPSTEWLTRNPYGLPGPDDIPQEKALEIAKEQFVASVPLVTAQGIEEHCKAEFFFRINKPEKPMWKVMLTLKEIDASKTGMDHKTLIAYDLFIADIDAKTGQVLKTYDDYQDDSADFAEMFM